MSSLISIIFIVMAQMRIQKELLELKNNPSPSFSAEPIEFSNLFRWQATIMGPGGTPYADGIFFVEINFPKDYPCNPPRCKFLTKIYHPNISASSNFIFANILHGDWAPTLTISKVIEYILILMANPDINDCIQDSEMANLYEKNLEKFNAVAKEWTKKYAQ